MTRRLQVLSRLLAGTLFGAAITALWLVAIQPVVDRHKTYDMKIADAQMRLTRYEAASGQLEELSHTLRALRTRQQTSGAFLTGTTRAIAASRLQERLANSVREAGGQVQSQETVQNDGVRDGDDASGERITVRLQISIDEPGLHRFLATIETSRPVLFVHDISVRSGALRSMSSGGGARLSVDLEITGHRTEMAG